MKHSGNTSHRNQFKRAAAAAAVFFLLAGSAGGAYAANLGGIQRRVQLWINGEMTDAELVIEENGTYTIKYPQKDGSSQTLSGGGVALENDGSERPLSETEIMEHLLMPDVEYEDDGSVWVYYYDQKIEITDLFENGVCYVKLQNGDGTLYMTVKYDNGYSVSSDKYPSPYFFN